MTDRREGSRFYGHHPSCDTRDCDACAFVIPVGEDNHCLCLATEPCPIERDCSGPCAVGSILNSGHQIRWPSGAIATCAGPRIVDLREEHDIARNLLLERGVDPCSSCVGKK